MKTLKKYTTPKMEIIDAEMNNALLCASGDESCNPYWEGPGEVPEGCQSNWWCGK